jgi:hypothetical protein
MRVRLFYFLLFPLISFSQSVTLPDLEYGMKHSVAQIEEYLIPKGFELFEEQGMKNNQFFYSYIKSTKDHGVTYYAWLNSELGVAAIEILMQNGSDFINIKKQARSQGYQIDKRYMKNALANEEYYSKGLMLIKFSSSVDEVLGTVYHVFCAIN